jgi:hypothetical protein
MKRIQIGGLLLGMIALTGCPQGGAAPPAPSAPAAGQATTAPVTPTSNATAAPAPATATAAPKKDPPVKRAMDALDGAAGEVDRAIFGE